MGGELGKFWLEERDSLSSLRFKTPRGSAVLLGGGLSNRAISKEYSHVLELVRSLHPSDLFSVDMKDWNRRLKICKIFTTAELLDLLASIREV